MSVFAQNSVGMLDWVLILAPYRRDASYMASLLIEHGIRAQAVTATELADRIAEFPGVLVVTHEALNPVAINTIAQFLQDQPNWSEIPIVVLLDRAAPQSRIQSALAAAWPRSRQTFTDLRMERILRRAGWTLQRLGAPQRIGATVALAGLLPIEQGAIDALRRNGGLTGPVLPTTMPLPLAA